MSKYNSKKTVIDGQKFDSKKEANRYIEELRKDGVAIATTYRTSANGKRYGVYKLAD